MSFSAVAEQSPLSARALLNAFSSPCAIVNSAGIVLHRNAALSRYINIKEGDAIYSLLAGRSNGREFLRTMARNRSIKHYNCTPMAAIDEFVISSSLIDSEPRCWLVELHPNTQRKSNFSALTQSRKELIVQTKENLRLSDAMAAAQTLAHIDPLTNIANRRAFDEELIANCKRASRESTWLSVVMIDIDNFKTVNDRLGHSHGDQILQQVAGSLAAACHREGDLCARYGGEEFVLIFPHADIPGATHLACQVVSTVEALAIPHPESSVSPVITISAGVHSIKPFNSDPGTTGEQLRRAADSALYQAKSAGRNCTVHFDNGVVIKAADYSRPTGFMERPASLQP